METIKGYDNYEIDCWGNVWSKKYNKFLKPRLRNDYLAVVLCIEGKLYNFYIHRLLALQFIDNPNNLPCVDHIDRDTQNNSLDNLRWVTYSQNSRNKTGVKGYTWDKKRNKYVASYTLNKKKYHIGSYDTKEEARQAYLNAIKDL
tara:strand:+ start:2822 stop:3256 length:435 start_codon:yes stop_codon:yes gene_type:complete